MADLPSIIMPHARKSQTLPSLEQFFLSEEMSRHAAQRKESALPSIIAIGRVSKLISENGEG